MRRSPLPLLVSCLALVTSLALLATGQVLTLPGGSAAGRLAAAEANVDLVRRFYEAANDVLSTGDAGLLDGLVAADLVEHPPRLVATGRTGLSQSLGALGATFPGSTLVVDDLRAAGDDLVVARVHVEAPRRGTFAGLAISSQELAVWGPLEQFRLAGGKIAEHWSSRGDAVAFAPLWRLPRFAGGGRQLIVVERLTFAPDASLFATAVDGAQALAIERERLSVTLQPVPTRTATADDSRQSRLFAAVATAPTTLGLGDHLLAAGDLLMAPDGVSVAGRNDGDHPATALRFMVLPTVVAPARAGKPGAANVPPTIATTELAPGVTATLLSVGTVEDVAPLATLALGRVVLAPGQRVAVDPIPGPSLLAVEAGRLELAVDAGNAEVTRATAPDGESAPATRSLLGTGDGAMLVAGSRNAWQAVGDEPAVVLVLTLLPTS